MYNGVLDHPGIARILDVAHTVEALNVMGTSHEPACAVYGDG
jgi:hypothetical protein